MSDQQRVLLFTYGGIAALVAVLCIAAIIVFSSFSAEPETARAEESTASEVSYVEELPAEAADAVAAPSFTVKSIQGGIGVFDAFGTLIRSLPVEVSTLPAADQNALKRGIDVTGKEALDKLLQDLTS